MTFSYHANGWPVLFCGRNLRATRQSALGTDFPDYYATLSDDQLLHIASDRRDLRPEAGAAMDAELARRNLTLDHARAKGRAELREELQELRGPRRKRKKSKYLVTQMNIGGFFIGLAGMVICWLVMPFSLSPTGWGESISLVYLGALLAVLAVQPWVRKTARFWVCLLISMVPQFLLSHWLAVYHPGRTRGADKGNWGMSLLSGWLLGSVVFFLFQKIRPVKNPELAE